MQFFVNMLRTRFLAGVADAEDRKAFVYLLARYVKAFHFLTCFFTYAPELKVFVAPLEYGITRCLLTIPCSAARKSAPVLPSAFA